MPGVWRETTLLAKHSLVYAAGTMLQRIAGFFLLPLYTTYLTPQDYGAKELVGMSADFVAIVLSTSISASIYRFYFARTAESERLAVISTALLLLGGLSLVTLPLVAFAAPALASWLLDDPSKATYIYLALGTMFFNTLNGISFLYLRARQRSFAFVSIAILQLLAGIGLNIYLIAIRHLGVTGVFISSVISSALVFIILTVPLLRKTGFVLDRDLSRRFFSFGAPLAPAALLGFAASASGRVLLKLLGSLHDTGLYSLGIRFGTLPSAFVAKPFNSTWLPRRFEIARRDDSEFVFARIFTYFFALITLAGLFVSLASRDVIRIMANPSFHDASTVIPLLALANVVFSLHFHLHLGLMLTGHTKYFAFSQLANAIVTVGLNVLLIPRFGAQGAALALLSGYSAKNALLYFFCRRYYPLRFEVLRLAKVVIAAVALYLLLRALDTGSPLVNIVLRALGSGIGFILLLLLMRFLTDSEVHRLRAIGQRFRQFLKSRIRLSPPFPRDR